MPVSPLIAGMVSDLGTQAPRYRGNPTARIIADIRRGAARQHLDYVLVYEVGSSQQSKANALALADLTIIGMFVLPSRSMTVEASASGILIDVRNGYPYATVTAHAEKGGIARAINSWSKANSLSDTAEERAVLNLSGEVRTVMQQLSEMAEAAE